MFYYDKQDDFEYKVIPSSRDMKDIYHIKHISASHSNFKPYLQKFREGSTKIQVY